AGEPGRVIRLEDHVGGRVVGIAIHGVGPGKGQRGREADVARDRPQDPGRQSLPTTGGAVNLKAPMFVNLSVLGSCQDLASGPRTSDLLASPVTSARILAMVEA